MQALALYTDPVAWLTATVDGETAAHALAAAGVQAHLAACAQVEAMQSHYWWDGVLQRGAEWRITWKTTPAQRPALQALLQAAHPYTLPQWLWGSCQASPAYAAWVAQAVTPPVQA